MPTVDAAKDADRVPETSEVRHLVFEDELQLVGASTATPGGGSAGRR